MAETLRITFDTGPCEEVLCQYPSDHFDTLITDPPYGLGDIPDVDDLLNAWVSGEGTDMDGGFMDEQWDVLPPPAVWEEVLRVLIPGRRGAVFAGTRTWDLMQVSLKLGGFVVEDVWQWTYGGGFPKSYNVYKHVRRGVEDRYGSKRCECSEDAKWDPSGGPDSEIEADRKIIPDNWADRKLVTRVCSWCLLPDDRFLDALEGRGTALKPAAEYIIIVEKPEEPRDREELLERYGITDE